MGRWRMTPRSLFSKAFAFNAATAAEDGLQKAASIAGDTYTMTGVYSSIIAAPHKKQPRPLTRFTALAPAAVTRKIV